MSLSETMSHFIYEAAVCLGCRVSKFVLGDTLFLFVLHLRLSNIRPLRSLYGFRQTDKLMWKLRSGNGNVQICIFLRWVYFFMLREAESALSVNSSFLKGNKHEFKIISELIRPFTYKLTCRGPVYTLFSFSCGTF